MKLRILKNTFDGRDENGEKRKLRNMGYERPVEPVLLEAGEIVDWKEPKAKAAIAAGWAEEADKSATVGNPKKPASKS